MYLFRIYIIPFAHFPQLQCFQCPGWKIFQSTKIVSWDFKRSLRSPSTVYRQSCSSQERGGGRLLLEESNPSLVGFLYNLYSGSYFYFQITDACKDYSFHSCFSFIWIRDKMNDCMKDFHLCLMIHENLKMKLFKMIGNAIIFKSCYLCPGLPRADCGVKVWVSSWITRLGLPRPHSGVRWNFNGQTDAGPRPANHSSPPPSRDHSQPITGRSPTIIDEAICKTKQSPTKYKFPCAVVNAGERVHRVSSSRAIFSHNDEAAILTLPQVEAPVDK